MQSKLELLEKRIEKAERRLRSTRMIAFGGVAGALVLALHPEAQAQFAITLTSLQNQINALTPRVTAVETKTQFVSVSSGEMFITGTNVYIQNGLGATNGNPSSPLNTSASTVNGKGNLIIGYNVLRSVLLPPSTDDHRTGSHNLIMGDGNNYTAYGGMVGGLLGSTAAAYASVSGGQQNTASGVAAWVGGGISNTASSLWSSVSGGSSNTAMGGNSASVSGGSKNTASGTDASVSGGLSITQANNSGWSAGGTGAGTFHAP